MKKSQEKIIKIISELEDKFPERERLVIGAMTALIAGEHVLMLGPPGTAKSLFARRIAEATAGGSFFELLLTKFTTVEEMYGPISFSALKKDKYMRILDGFAATKRVWFLDEIFKSSSAILNCQLTAMNERMFHNGGSPVPIPLDMVLAASNEYPQDESLKALFDRFTLKYWVDYISDRDQLERLMLAGGVDKMNNVMNDSELDELRDLCANVPFGSQQVKILLDIKVNIEAEGFTVSDRNWVKAIKMIKARAVLSGRDVVKSSDYLILADMFWKEHKDRERLHTIIGNASDPYGSKAIAIIDAVKTTMKRLPDIAILKSGQKTKVEFMQSVNELSSELTSRRQALDAIEKESSDNDSVKDAADIVNNAIKTIQELSKKALFGE